MNTFELPAYIDPAVLVPGQTVQCILDGTETILTVVRVEPALICSKPDGSGVMVLAHTVVPVDIKPVTDGPLANHPDFEFIKVEPAHDNLDALVREGTCSTCSHKSYQHRLTYRDTAGVLRGWSCVMFNCRCEQFVSGVETDR